MVKEKGEMVFGFFFECLHGYQYMGGRSHVAVVIAFWPIIRVRTYLLVELSVSLFVYGIVILIHWKPYLFSYCDTVTPYIPPT